MEFQQQEQEQHQRLDIVPTIATAVDMMRASRYSETMDLLRSGLGHLLSLAERTSPTSSSLLSSCSSDTLVSLESVSLRLCEEEEDHEDEPSKQYFFGASAFGALAIYDKALRFAGETTDAIFWEGDNVHRASSVLLYNTALVHHLLGLQGPNQQRHLKKALKLYEMAMDVLHNCKKHSAVDKMITLAIFNNKGHVYCQFSELTQVQVCIDWLKSILDCCAGDFPNRDDELLHFRLTVLLWDAEHCPPAAPAA